MSAVAMDSPDVTCRRLFIAATCKHFLETFCFQKNDIGSRQELQDWALKSIDSEIALISNQEPIVEELMWKIGQEMSVLISQMEIRIFTRGWKPIEKLCHSYSYRHMLAQWIGMLYPIWDRKSIEVSALAKHLETSQNFGRDLPNGFQDQPAVSVLQPVETATTSRSRKRPSQSSDTSRSRKK
jgi:hypothetical protein